MSRKIALLCTMFAVCTSSALEEDFSNLEFTGGIPAGWEESTASASGSYMSFTDSPASYGSKKAVGVNLYSAQSNAVRVLYRTSPLENVYCDNISVAVPVYLQKNLSGKVDRIQAVVSTNNFESYIGIGEPKDLQELARSSDAWATNHYN